MKPTNKTIGEVADVIAGQSPPSNLYNKTGEGLPFYQGKTDFGEKYPEAKTWCTGAKNKEAIQNDILLSVRAPVGPVNICQVRSVIGRGLSAIRAKKGNSFEYLFYYLKNHEQDIAKLGTGSTFKAITQTHINRIQLPIPESYDVQIRIATVLTRAERLIAKRKESIKALDELLKGTFLEMFGNPESMLKQPKTKLNDFIFFLTSGSRGWAQYYTETGHVFLRINNVRDASLKLDDLIYVNPPVNAEAIRTKVSPNDLLFSITADLGRTAVVPESLNGAFINQHLALIRLDQKKIHPLFVAWFFAMPYGKSIVMKKNREGVKAGLNFDDIRGFDLVVPPLPLQNQFAAIVEKVESIKAKQTQSLAELENLYGSLSQRAFKGELDLSRVPVVYEVEAEPLETKMTISADVKVKKAFSKDELINILKTKACTS